MIAFILDSVITCYISISLWIWEWRRQESENKNLSGDISYLYSNSYSGSLPNQSKSEIITMIYIIRPRVICPPFPLCPHLLLLFLSQILFQPQWPLCCSYTSAISCLWAFVLIPFPWHDLPEDILLDSPFSFLTMFPVKNHCPQSPAIALLLLTLLFNPFSYFIYLYTTCYCCVSYLLFIPPPRIYTVTQTLISFSFTTNILST